MIQEDEAQGALLFRRMVLPSEKDKSQRLLSASEELRSRSGIADLDRGSWSQAMPSVQWYQGSAVDITPLHVQGINPTVAWPLNSSVEAHVRLIPAHGCSLIRSNHDTDLLRWTRWNWFDGITSPWATLRREVADPCNRGNAVVPRHIRLSRICETIGI